MKDISIFDIDGTIARPLRQWQRLFSYDTMEAAMRIMDPCRVAQDVPALQADVGAARLAGEVYALSGRAEWSRDITEAWLVYHHGRFDGVFLRKGDDLRESYVIKGEKLATWSPSKSTVRMFDDDLKMLSQTEALGFWFIYVDG